MIRPIASRYPSAWLSGKGRHRLEYALVARESGWNESRIPQMAWEYNCPPIAVQGCKPRADSFIKTSGNVIVEAMARTSKSASPSASAFPARRKSL